MRSLLEQRAYIPLNQRFFHYTAILVVFVPLIGTAVAILLLWQRAVHLSDMLIFAVSYVLGMLGITIGFHRMLSHRSFQPHPVVKFIFLILGSMSAQGPALEWAATHIKHHALTDREGDPHSPVEGLLHAHVGWFLKNGMVNPNEFCPYITKDKMVRFVSYTTLVWMALGFLVPFALGGWSGMLWGGLVRMFLVNHVIWGINTICHTYGMRDFETNDRSHNEWFFGILGLGDGWHNNHHAFPRSAFSAHRWWQFDPSGYLIWVLERVGLARDVHRMSPALFARYAQRSRTSTITPETDE